MLTGCRSFSAISLGTEQEETSSLQKLYSAAAQQRLSPCCSAPLCWVLSRCEGFENNTCGNVYDNYSLPKEMLKGNRAAIIIRLTSTNLCSPHLEPLCDWQPEFPRLCPQLWCFHGVRKTNYGDNERIQRSQVSLCAVRREPLQNEALKQ